MNQQSDLAIDFLKSHRLGVLATGRRDGSPQQALIAYNFDGKEVAINTGEQSAKAKNLAKRPRASLSVTDGPKVVVVYGQARIARGAEAESYRERLQAPRPAADAPARTAPQRQQIGERVVIILTPEKILANRLEG